MTQLLFPGDSLAVTDASLGPNLTGDSNGAAVAVSAGALLTKQRHNAPQLYYVDSPFGRYTPDVGDLVLGTIAGQLGEFYKVELNEFSSPAILNMFAFPNASKKNRPRLEVRDLVYARVDAVHVAVDPELSCVDSITGKDGGFGVLRGGYCFNVPPAFARYLMYTPNAPVVAKLVQKVEFEMAIGVNGKVWVKAGDVKLTLLCVSVLSQSVNWKPEDVNSNVDKLLVKFKSV